MVGKATMVGVEFVFKFFDVDEDGFARKCDVWYDNSDRQVLVKRLQKGGSEAAWETIREFLEEWRNKELGNV